MNTPQPASAPPATTPVAKKASHKPSITGFVLTLVSLLFTALANFSIHAKYTPTGPTTGSAEAEVGHAIGTGTTTVLGSLFGMMFIVGAIVFALLALLFIILRLRNVKVSGLIFSIIVAGLSIWSMVVSIGLMSLLKADPA